MLNEQTKIRAAWVLLLLMSLGVLIEAGFPSQVPENEIPYLDKMLHFLIYGMIAYLNAYLYLKRKSTLTVYTFIYSILLVLFLGIAAESIQSITPGRDASLADIIADLSGACVFLLVLHKQHTYKVHLSQDT